MTAEFQFCKTKRAPEAGCTRLSAYGMLRLGQSLLCCAHFIITLKFLIQNAAIGPWTWEAMKPHPEHTFSGKASSGDEVLGSCTSSQTLLLSGSPLLFLFSTFISPVSYYYILLGMLLIQESELLRNLQMKVEYKKIEGRRNQGQRDERQACSTGGVLSQVSNDPNSCLGKSQAVGEALLMLSFQMILSNQLLNICVYSHRFVLLPTFVKGSCSVLRGNGECRNTFP